MLPSCKNFLMLTCPPLLLMTMKLILWSVALLMQFMQLRMLSNPKSCFEFRDQTQCLDASNSYIGIWLVSSSCFEVYVTMEAVAVAQLQRDISSTSLTSSSTVKENVMVAKIVVDSQLKQKTVAASTSSSTVKDNMMVGYEEVFLEVLDKLTGDQLNRQIIPITGMGGIGKTTLAIYLFANALVKEHFDIRAWTTISQTFNVRETL